MEMVFAIRDLDLIPRSCGSDHPAASPTIALNRLGQPGKPSYWRSLRGLKLATTLLVSSFSYPLFLYMMVVQAGLLIEWMKLVFSNFF